MIYRKLRNEDYSFGHSSQDFYQGTEAVCQAIKTNLLLLLGEWWEDTSQGLPLFNSILSKKNTRENIQSIDLLIKEKIISTKDAIDIQAYSGTYSKGTYTINCTVSTKYGDVNLGEVTFK